MICDSSTGVCSCKSNIDTTSNTICDTCMDGFWNISDSNPDGCQGKYFIKHVNSNIVFFFLQHAHVTQLEVPIKFVIRHLVTAHVQACISLRSAQTAR